MIRKSYLLLGLVLVSFAKLSPTKYSPTDKPIPGADYDVSWQRLGQDTTPPDKPTQDLIADPVRGWPLCITPQTRAWLLDAKFLAVSAKKTFSIVGKDKATKWTEVRLSQPEETMMLGAPNSYTAALLSTGKPGYLACKKTGELYLSPKQNQESVWNAVGHPSTGYPTTYSSKKYGFQLDASKMVTKKKKVGKKTVSLLMLKK